MRLGLTSERHAADSDSIRTPTSFGYMGGSYYFPLDVPSIKSRSRPLQMFDNVLLLVRGGRSAYSGPREEVLGFFEASGHPCPKNFKLVSTFPFFFFGGADFFPYSPADFLLDVISVDYRSQEGTDKSLARVSMILDSWTTTSTARKRATREIPAQTNLAAKQRAAPLLVAFPVVLGRSFKFVFVFFYFLLRC